MSHRYASTVPTRLAPTLVAPVESFLAAVNTFKEVEKLDDKLALAGLPLILTDDAAIWWQGSKDNVLIWNDFTDRLRSTFAPKKMAYKIYQEIIEIKQDSQTPTEIFVAEKRALLAQLPKPTHSDQQQIDLVFGQIRFEIREKISRNSISSFDELLMKARDIERNLSERDDASTVESKQDYKQKKARSRCNFCRSFGHTYEICRKRLRADEMGQRVPHSETQNAAVAETAPLNKPTFSCYGCGEPGVVRSRCTKCCQKKKETVMNDISFCSLHSQTEVHLRPVVTVKIGGVKGKAHVDTCAKSSVASYSLYKCLEKNGYAFKEEVMYITLADGIAKRQRILTVKAPVTIYGKVIPTSFIIFPNSRDNRTLLGVGFIQEARMVLNLPQMTFTFDEEPNKVYELDEEDDDMDMVMGIIRTDTAIPDLLSPLQYTPDYLKSPQIPQLPESSATYSRSMSSFGPLPEVTSVHRSYDTLHSEQASIPPMDLLGAAPAGFLSERKEKPYGPLIAIDLSSPPKKKRIVLFDGHSPVMDSLYADACRNIEEQTVVLSPHSESLFPSTDISSMDISTENSVMTEDQLPIMKRFLQQNEDVFMPNQKPSTQAELVIDTGTHLPISAVPYKFSPAEVQSLKAEIDKMLSEKIIEPCVSPWSAPAVMVSKKGGDIRVCIDYRQLNAVTIPDIYPLPKLDQQLLHDARQMPFMTTIDLRSSVHHWQLALREEDQIKTTFITPFGMFKFLRMPLGLRNAPCTIQRLMDKFRISLSHIHLVVSLDCLVCLSPTFHQHLKDLQEVFNRLKEYSLTANKAKCRFYVDREASVQGEIESHAHNKVVGLYCAAFTSWTISCATTAASRPIRQKGHPRTQNPVTSSSDGAGNKSS
ncbi:unnamed protein product [Plutella xylostella]|uniref:(diamondback moth) hypothetical protein n=1 Tax=Plutella xylostella TaxID=51655 RepID=A0A8S4ENI5_PLUXY|nr:unnamed protein product [Plutella xylostella]